MIYYYNEKTGRSEIIQAFFHSNAGGFTENSENVWNEALPYLRQFPQKKTGTQKLMPTKQERVGLHPPIAGRNLLPGKK